MNVFRILVLIVSLWSGAWPKTLSAQQMRPLAANQLVLPKRSYTIAFEWQGDSTGSLWEPYAALLLPVRLAGCPRQLYMQFDSGSPCSMFYKGRLRAIMKNCSGTVTLTDSTSKLENYTFYIGEMPVTARSIAVNDTGEDQSVGMSPIDFVVIGTIGADFIDDRAILIDYPQKRITTGQEISPGLDSGAILTEFSFVGRSILLPAVVNGARSVLFFDTGTSAFELLTDKQNFYRMATEGALPAQSLVRSWNKVLTAHTVSTRDSIEIACQRIPVRHVTYMEGVSAKQVEQMRKLGIGGMTGNKLFLRNRLFLDTRHKKFAILDPTKSE